MIAYSVYKKYISKQFDNIPTLKKSAKFGETLNISDNNFNIEISNVVFDKDNNFNAEIYFSTINETGVSTYITYDYLIYDADTNVIATSLSSSLNKQKKAFISGFTSKYYNKISFKNFVKHIIGINHLIPNMSEEGTIHHTISGDNFKTVSNFKNLTIRLTNIQYKELGNQNTIIPDKDFIFLFSN